MLELMPESKSLDTVNGIAFRDFYRADWRSVGGGSSR